MNALKRELIAVFYNVENLFDIYDDPKTSDEAFTPDGMMAWDEQRYQTKLQQISKAILGIDQGKAPAFMGFAEIENRKVLEDLLKQSGLAETHYEIVHQESEDTRGIDIAFIYQPGVFDFHEAVWHDINSFSTEKINARDVLQVTGTMGNQVFHFFVNHWSSRRKGKTETEFKRIAAAKTLRHAIDQCADDSVQIIMGDFNDEPNDISITKYLRALEHAEEGTKELVNLSWRYEQHGKGSIEHEGEWYLFDQMMVSLNLRKGTPSAWKVKKMYLEQNEELIFRSKGNSKPNRTYVGIDYKGGFSDHLPVFVRIQERYKNA